jgi:hypothetical protein
VYWCRACGCALSSCVARRKVIVGTTVMGTAVEATVGAPALDRCTHLLHCHAQRSLGIPATFESTLKLKRQLDTAATCSEHFKDVRTGTITKSLKHNRKRRLRVLVLVGCRLDYSSLARSAALSPFSAETCAAWFQKKRCIKVRSLELATWAVEPSKLAQACQP